MHINQQPHTYPENFRALALTVLAGEATRRKKKAKIAALPTARSFGGTIFGGWWIDSDSKKKICLHSCNFGFFRLVINC